jgi:hypothetical protein
MKGEIGVANLCCKSNSAEFLSEFREMGPMGNLARSSVKILVGNSMGNSVPNE